ncbi:glycerol acyltransferase [Rubrobacter radiotolerans]|uniref:Phospholipid/glycerol acyltransferase domain-containing protein n=1 Tax=Rubrobacter radiotolerans TaxID=42256 RepID=A0AB35TCG0_RUBRA|nr:glycerol acyltransferase [Rubrobacter radiotolerans]MDX5894810.1 hypothetical protein [Rubrobacter radiotolerans]SMC06810.1 phospholipid/glycerol acyltransferase [Rubrobacter radiotolerans DSM 5868]
MRRVRIPAKNELDTASGGQVRREGRRRGARRGAADPGVELLTRVCAGELLEAFGLDRRNRLVEPAGRLAARGVARKAARYDRLVGERGLGAGGRWALGEATRSATFRGVRAVPTEGPLIVVSNHPGLSDTLALFAAIPRDDLMVIAARRDFLDALPNTRKRLFVLDDGEAAGRTGGLGVVRSATRHLRDGGALLTFPGGRIEPDPAEPSEVAGALASVERWRGNVELFARLVPEARVVPALVRGVLSRRALRNPLVYLRRGERERLWLAATLQMLSPRLHPADVRVDFARPVEGGSPGEVAEAVLRHMRSAILSTG